METIQPSLVAEQKLDLWSRGLETYAFTASLFMPALCGLKWGWRASIIGGAATTAIGYLADMTFGKKLDQRADAAYEAIPDKDRNITFDANVEELSHYRYQMLGYAQEANEPIAQRARAYANRALAYLPQVEAKDDCFLRLKKLARGGGVVSYAAALIMQGNMRTLLVLVGTSSLMSHLSLSLAEGRHEHRSAQYAGYLHSARRGKRRKAFFKGEAWRGLDIPDRPTIERWLDPED